MQKKELSVFIFKIFSSWVVSLWVSDSVYFCSLAAVFKFVCDRKRFNWLIYVLGRWFEWSKHVHWKWWDLFVYNSENILFFKKVHECDMPNAIQFICSLGHCFYFMKFFVFFFVYSKLTISSWLNFFLKRNHREMIAITQEYSTRQLIWCCVSEKIKFIYKTNIRSKDFSFKASVSFFWRRNFSIGWIAETIAPAAEKF